MMNTVGDETPPCDETSGFRRESLGLASIHTARSTSSQASLSSPLELTKPTPTSSSLQHRQTVSWRDLPPPTQATVLGQSQKFLVPRKILSALVRHGETPQAATEPETKTGKAKHGALSAFDKHVAPYMPDFYQFIPSYQWGVISGRLSKLMTLITIILMAFYMAISLHGFFTTTPRELQRSTRPIDMNKEFALPLSGFQLWYQEPDGAGNGTYRSVNASNTDRYFRFDVYSGSRHDGPPYLPNGEYASSYTAIDPNDIVPCNGAVPLSEFLSGSTCIDPEKLDKYRLQGLWYVGGKHQDFYIRLARCVNVTSAGEPCASTEDIFERIRNSPRVYIEFVTQTSSFNPSKFHKEGNGLTKVHSNFYSYFNVGHSVQHNVIFKHHKAILHSQWLGSVTKRESFLQYDHVDSTDIPQQEEEQEEFMSFYFLLDPFEAESDVSYPVSIFTLFAAWGGFFNIITVVTFGSLARRVNSHLFKKRFLDSAGTFVDGQQDTTARQSEVIDRNRYTSQQARVQDHKEDLFRELWSPSHKMDIRLFDAQNFDETGQLILSKEELLHPSTVFGELRLLALVERSRKRKGAAKICEFYVKYVKGYSRTKPVSLGV